MKKLAAGVALCAALLSVGPMVGTAFAHPNPPPSTTDPVLCFVASNAIITEALHEYREGHLTARELRQVLKGTSVFLADCLSD